MGTADPNPYHVKAGFRLQTTLLFKLLSPSKIFKGEASKGLLERKRKSPLAQMDDCRWHLGCNCDVTCGSRCTVPLGLYATIHITCYKHVM